MTRPPPFPRAGGIAERPITSMNSTTDPGHPWVRMIGSAFLLRGTHVNEMNANPSIWVRYCEKALMRASKRRHHTCRASRQRAPGPSGGGRPATSRRRFPAPATAWTLTRRLRSLSAASGTCTVKGLTSSVAAGGQATGPSQRFRWASIGNGPAANKPAPQLGQRHV